MTTSPDGSVTGEPRPRPRSLRWLYGVLAALLVSLGVIIGKIWFSGPSAWFIPFTVTQEQCAARYPGDRKGLGDCIADQTRLQGIVILIGLLVVFAGTLALAVAVPWLDERRLRRLGRLDRPAASERFAELCRQHGLSGPRQPQLWVAGPAVRHAFTTALPGRRPTVVVPARLAVGPSAEGNSAAGPGERFDAVVTHELAHVLARDVTWVSSVRGPVWLLPPVFVLATVPLISRIGATADVLAAIAGIMLLAATIAVLAAALLRLRELEADRYAAAAGAQPTLLTLFSQATNRRERWTARLLARHPSPADRVVALRNPARAYEGGFAQAAVIGFATIIAMGTVILLAASLDGRLSTYSGGIVPATVGAAVLSLLFPSLVRRARVGLSNPQWWRPIVGAAAGVSAGAAILPVVTLGSVLPFPLAYPGSFVRTTLAVALLALVVSGLVALTIGVAELLTRADQPAAARFAIGAAALAAVPALWFVSSTAALLHSPVNLRYFLAYSAAGFWWPALGLGLLVPYALLALREWPRRRLPWLVAAAATTVAGTAAILVRSDDLLRAQQQRWWICVAAGLVVLIVVTVAVPWPYGWGWGVLASTATTAAATATHYASGLLTDRPSEPDLFAADAAVASVWLSFATVLAAAVLVPLRGVRRPGPRPVVRRLVPVAALVVTAAVALTISGTGVPGGAALSLVQQQQAAFDARYAPLRHALTAEQAQRVATTVILVMPLTWRGGPGRKPGDGVVSPDAVLSRPACEPLIRERFLAAGEPHLRATGRYDVSSRTETTGLKYTTITVTTFSYDAPVGERILTAARDARRQCPAFQVAGETVRIDFQVRPGNPPDLGELSFRYDSTLSASVAGQEITGTNAYVMLSVGYTVITVYMAAVGQPLDEELLQKVAAGVENALLSLR